MVVDQSSNIINQTTGSKTSTFNPYSYYYFKCIQLRYYIEIKSY